MSLHAAETEGNTVDAPPRRDSAKLREQLDAALQRVDRDVRDAAAWREIGRTCTLLGRDDEAVTAFEHALELEQDLKRPDLWLALAIAAMRSGHYDSALRAFEWLTGWEPGEPVFWIFRSMALRNLDRAEEAAGALRRAVSVEPDPEKRFFIAFALGLLGRYDEALELDEQAIRYD